MSRTRGEETAPRVLAVDKPVGPTSHELVQRARRALGTRRVGHTGTLDPFASGLLLLCVGRATRLAEYFHLLAKTYEAELTLGLETDTLDPTGEPVRRGAWEEVTEADLRAALAAHTGSLRQRPPAFSAVRVGGRRAHVLSRAGTPPDLDPRPVRVHALELRAWEPPAFAVRAVVSTGTYVRALARDIGRALGCGAHLSALRRTAIGPFRVEEAIPAASLQEGGLPPGAGMEPAAALGWLPRRELDEGEEIRVVAGGAIPAGRIEPPELPGPPPGRDLPVRLVFAGRLVAVARAAEGELRPRKVLG